MNNGEPTIRAPRAPWMEFLLHFATFGVYTSIWIAIGVRELNKVSDTKFTPWLWFFVPAIWLSWFLSPAVVVAQVIALPRLIRRVNELGERLGVPRSRAWSGWLACVVLVTVALAVSGAAAFPLLPLVSGVLVWAALFAIAQRPVNAVKRQLKNVRFKGSEKGYSIVEWLVIVPLLSIIIVAAIYIAFAPKWMTQTIVSQWYDFEPLDANSTYSDPDSRYLFPVVGEGWAIVPRGTSSKGDADIELQTLSSNIYFSVFAHGRDESLDSVSRGRISQAQYELSDARCTEQRSFAQKDLSVVSRIVCFGALSTGNTMRTISLVETDDGIYELHGRMFSEGRPDGNSVDAMRTMANGFEPK